MACILALIAGCGGRHRASIGAFTCSPSAGASPLSVFFNASTSSDPGGEIHHYDWDFGDGTTATGATAVHTYVTPGRYRAQLTVTDDRGASHRSSKTITVTEPREERIVGTEAGQLAPEFTLADLRGQSRSLSAFRGHVVILSFWQTSCPTCAALMPDLVALYRNYNDQGVAMVGVNLDYVVEATVGYLEENGYTDLVTLWGSYDAAMSIVGLYKVPEVPYMFLIDRQGMIRFIGNENRPLTEDDVRPWL